MWSASSLVVICVTPLTLLLTSVLCDAQPTRHGLVLEATCRVASDSEQTEFHLVLRNDSGSDTAVVVGTALANGRAYLPIGVSVQSTTPAGEEKFSYSPVPPVFVSGRVDPWLVPLPHRATYSLSVPTAHFWNLGSGHMDQAERTVRIVLEAQLPKPRHHDMRGLELWNVWTGELASPAMKSPADCRRGK